MDFYRARLADFALPLVPLDLLDRVAQVYQHKYYDLHGDTAAERRSISPANGANNRKAWRQQKCRRLRPRSVGPHSSEDG